MSFAKKAALTESMRLSSCKKTPTVLAAKMRNQLERLLAEQLLQFVASTVILTELKCHCLPSLFVTDRGDSGVTPPSGSSKTHFIIYSASLLIPKPPAQSLSNIILRNVFKLHA